MRSITLLLSIATVLYLSLQINAYCDQSIVNLCLRQLGLNSSNPANINLIQDCHVAVPAGCVGVNQTCNTNLPVNSTYDVICTATGISFYNSSSACFNYSDGLTSALCSQTVSPSISCATDDSGNKFLKESTVNSLIRSIKNCSTSPTTTPSGLQLLPNPVGPAAITAIVVLVCLAIIAVLAGFFFWPKCHIADPAAEALKKATKPASAKAKTEANSYAVSSQGASGAIQNKASVA